MAADPTDTAGSSQQDRITTSAAHRTDERDLCPHCSKPLTEHRNRDCWPRCGKPNPNDPTELCSLPERHADLLNCPPCAYDVLIVTPLAALDALVREVGGCGVEHDDERMDYLTVQIDRELWNRVREIADNPLRAAQP